MTLSKTTIISSFLLIIVANCSGMELPKDQPLINNAEHAALFDTLAQKAPEALPNNEEIEALFGDAEALLHDHDRAQEVQKVLPCNEKVDLGNDDNEADKEINAISVSKRRRYECPVCKKSVGNLTLHMRSHTDEKPYHCDLCNYSGVQKSNLTLHKRTHTGEKPFKCKRCDYSCTQNGTLIIHMRSHTGEKPYHCDQCDLYFTQNTHLKKHKKRKHDLNMENLK